MAINNSLLYVGQIGSGGVVTRFASCTVVFPAFSSSGETRPASSLVLREDFRQKRRRPDVRPFHLLCWRANIHRNSGGDGSGGSVTVDGYS